MWVIDGAASPYWTPVSPVTGEIAFAEWKVPYDQLPRQAAPPRKCQPNRSRKPAAAVPANAGRHRRYAGAGKKRPLLPPPKPARAKPRIVEPVRPPDDPGLPEEDPERRASADS